MCFSATASFVAGTSLTALGLLTVKRAKRKKEIPFAAIPLLFGMQQIVEGVLWLSFDYDAVQLKILATYIFTVFSHVLWPMYMPFAVALIEPNARRRKIMRVFQVTGVAVGLFLLLLMFTLPLKAVVHEHIIYVSPHFYEWPVMILYLASTCLVAFFSSYGLIRFFGVLALLLFFVAYAIHSAAFFSVWCFFAAILSVIIYYFFSIKNVENREV